MAILPREEKPNSDKIVIDLDGPEGNAFNLMGVCRTLWNNIPENVRNLRDMRDIDEILEDMMSSDYEHLVQVMDDEFGDFIIMYK